MNNSAHPPSVRRGVVLVAMAFGSFVSVSIVAAPPAHAAVPPYCAKLSKIMSGADSAADSGRNPKAMKAMAAALRASGPPTEIKQGASDFAGGLDDLAGRIGKIKNASDARTLAKDFGVGSKYNKGLTAIFKYQAKVCSP